MFLPPAFCGEAQIDGAGIINPANVATINGRLANLLGDIVAAGLAPVLLHSDADPPDAITSLSLAPLIATQRRRLR